MDAPIREEYGKLSPEAQTEAREFIQKKTGLKYLAVNKRTSGKIKNIKWSEILYWCEVFKKTPNDLMRYQDKENQKKRKAEY